MKFTITIADSLRVTFLVAVLFLTTLSSVRAYSTTAANAPAETAGVNAKGAATDKTEVSNLIVTNNMAVVRFSPSRWDRLPLLGHYTANETVFLIRPINEGVASVIVTSSGLGNAVFMRETPSNVITHYKGEGLLSLLRATFGNIRSCPDVAWSGASSLFLSDLKVGEDVKVRLRFPCDLVKDPGDTLEGKILVIAPQQKVLEVPLKIQNPSASAFYTAMLWFLGVVIPTLVGYWIYKLQNKWSEHRTQWATLEKYIYDHQPTLADFFNVHYPEIFKGEDTAFAEKLRGEFAMRNYFENIPPRERRRIENAIARCNRKAIKKALARIFPLWKSQIKG